VYDIGTKFEYEWCPEHAECRNETLTIGGYIYYHDDLFYVCYSEDGDQVDVYCENVQDALENDDED
jgi:hypothetical protein